MNADWELDFCFEDGRLDINQLFKNYSKPLFYFASKFVDDEVAKDIVQDVFFKLWEDQDIRVESSLNGFLFTMVRNRCLQYIEKLKVREQYRVSAGIRLKEEELLFFSPESPDLIQQELQEKLESALKNLPDKCKTVFEMSRFQNKKNREIATELEISIKAVEKHISKALKQIRIELQDYLPFLFLVLHKIYSSSENSDFFLS